MACNGSCKCEGKWIVSDVSDFYKLPNTNTKCTVSGKGSDLKYFEVRDYEFTDSCKVIALSEEAFAFLGKDKSGILECQSVFAEWGTTSQMVTFWMKDNGSAKPTPTPERK